MTAAHAANAMEFIRKLPQGLQTLVGRYGIELTEGQKERIAFARALLKNSPILILDEAILTMDLDSEYHVQVALNTLIRDRTTLIIARRLSTLKKLAVLLYWRTVESSRSVVTKNYLHRRDFTLNSINLAYNYLNKPRNIILQFEYFYITVTSHLIV